MAVILAVGGGVLALFATLVLIVQAFRVHVGWGLASLFLPGAIFLFAVVHFRRVRGTVLLWAIGLAASAAGNIQLIRQGVEAGMQPVRLPWTGSGGDDAR